MFVLLKTALQSQHRQLKEQEASVSRCLTDHRRLQPSVMNVRVYQVVLPRAEFRLFCHVLSNLPYACMQR